MGIDVHGMNFLRYAGKNRTLDDTITIGRQGFHVREGYVRDKWSKAMARELALAGDDLWCETFLKTYLGSSKVDSVDNSEYEGATFTHDMNNVLPEDLVGQYDTVIDCGSLEHIYNIPLALKNCSLLAKAGGQIVHVLPANNFCGHGFWQFTPELFFSLYAPKNGYVGTEIFLAEVSEVGTWWRVNEIVSDSRLMVHNSKGLHILVRTVKVGSDFSHHDIQQSDYSSKWAAKDGGKTSSCQLEGRKAKVGIMASSLAPLKSLYRSYYRTRPSPRMRLNRLNPDLTKSIVNHLV
ncbi:MAG: hypothetical protein V7744_19770 [Pseudomonadales bacterium]